MNAAVQLKIMTFPFKIRNIDQVQTSEDTSSFHRCYYWFVHAAMAAFRSLNSFEGITFLASQVVRSQRSSCYFGLSLFPPSKCFFFDYQNN